MSAEAMSLAIPAAIMGVIALTLLPVGVGAGTLLGVARTIRLWRTRTPRA